MSTQTSTSRSHPTPEPIELVAERRPAGRTIVASLVAGAAAALVLVLVVFPGATEPIITGALLVGFGFGWALMAVVTVRRTRQPQRWAAVPAFAMGTTGIALIVLTPGNEALTALNWVWPPVMVALSGWVFVQVRRAVPGKSRWLLIGVTAVLVLASVGATYDNLARTSDEATVAAPGKLFDVGGFRLHLDCHGQGSPTVVLSNGAGGISAAWAHITDAVAETTRVCAYDRAGQGWSDEAPNPRDGVESARDLHTLLAAAGEHGPYVLVGHSTGGPYAMTYAAKYPDQVAGLVLLDSASPEQFTRMPAYPSQYQLVLRRGLALLPTLSRLGLGRLPVESPLPAADAAKVAAISSAPQYYRNQRDEMSVVPDVFAQAQALTTLGDRPLAVLTASAGSTGTEGWADAQDQLATLSTNAVHVTVVSSHEGLVQEAVPSVESVRAITDVISSVRTSAPLLPR